MCSSSSKPTRRCWIPSMWVKFCQQLSPNWNRQESHMMPTTKDDNYNDDDDRDNDHDYDDMSWKGQCDDDLTLVNVLGQYWNNHIIIGVTIWLTGEPAWPGVGAPRVSSIYDQNEPVAKAMSSIMMTFTIIQVMMLMVVRLGRSSLLVSIIILVMTHDVDDDDWRSGWSSGVGEHFS